MLCTAFLSFKSGDGLVGDSSSSHLRVGKMCYMCFDDIDRYVCVYAYLPMCC